MTHELYLSKEKRYNNLDYSFVFDYKNILKRDFKDTPSRKSKKTYFTVNEWKELIAKVKDIIPFHYIIFRLMVATCRIGGLVKIKVSEINLDIGFFYSIEKHGDVRYFFEKKFIQDLKWFIMRKGGNLIMIGYSQVREINRNIFRQILLEKI